MVKVLSVKIDGEEIHIFNSFLYIFESHGFHTLELDLIVSEVAQRRYNKEENHIIELVTEGTEINAFMFSKGLPGGLPRINLYAEIEGSEVYPFLPVFHEGDRGFPDIEEGLTIEEIRKVEMPEEFFTCKVKLPIDQVEWLSKKKPKEFKEFLQKAIAEQWEEEGKRENT
ncbi:hypothetical protein [Bacillus massiliglaciei]|uniref:hypothetical protein n=1 Tax=Bacillus massiliglaciei TaxID=1816693 RepID=UPI000DA5FDA9|nr:hypothetical protein [Bacillus massiliglaciei]